MNIFGDWFLHHFLSFLLSQLCAERQHFISKTRINRELSLDHHGFPSKSLHHCEILNPMTGYTVIVHFNSQPTCTMEVEGKWALTALFVDHHDCQSKAFSSGGFLNQMIIYTQVIQVMIARPTSVVSNETKLQVFCFKLYCRGCF